MLISASQLNDLEAAVSAFICAQRNKYLPRCSPLDRSQRNSLEPYFPAADLDRVRLLQLKGEQVENPAFLEALPAMGIHNAPNFSLMAAVTFDDIVVSYEPLRGRLLFHEMVHIVQYRLLRVSAFARHYVRGFLAGGSYEEIPLERCAYSLEARFAARKAAFQVEPEVIACLQAAPY